MIIPVKKSKNGMSDTIDQSVYIITFLLGVNLFHVSLTPVCHWLTHLQVFFSKAVGEQYSYRL